MDEETRQEHWLNHDLVRGLMMGVILGVSCQLFLPIAALLDTFIDGDTLPEMLRLAQSLLSLVTFFVMLYFLTKLANKGLEHYGLAPLEIWNKDYSSEDKTISLVRIAGINIGCIGYIFLTFAILYISLYVITFLGII